MFKVEAYDKDNDKYMLLDRKIKSIESAIHVAKRFVDFIIDDSLLVDGEPADCIIISDEETEQRVAYTSEYEIIMV